MFIHLSSYFLNNKKLKKKLTTYYKERKANHFYILKELVLELSFQ